MWGGGSCEELWGAMGSAPGSSDDNEEVWELWGSVLVFHAGFCAKGFMEGSSSLRYSIPEGPKTHAVVMYFGTKVLFLYYVCTCILGSVMRLWVFCWVRPMRCPLQSHGKLIHQALHSNCAW